jgi:hypothetical protein
MRIPPDNGADPRLTRRRDRMPVPDNAADQPREPASPTGNDDSSSAGNWYGSAADGAAGKGPVRGYPPGPGQPPPMYPPGQFASWNRSQAGRPAPRHGQPDSGRHQAQQSWQAAGPEPGRPAGSGYYGRGGGSETEPGYSMLAVSDPAADVTSTQTWQAVGDGRATGVWTMPDRPEPAGTEGDGGRSRPDGVRLDPVIPGTARPDLTRPGLAGPAAAGPGAVAGPGAAAGPGAVGPGTAGAGSAGPASVRLQPAGQTAARHQPDSRGSRRRGSAQAGSAPDASPPASGRRAARGGSDARTGQNPVAGQQKRKRPAGLKVAITSAVVLVLAAVAALSYAVLRTSPKPPPAAPVVTKPTDAPSPSPTLGPYGDIGSRTSDPVPLTVAQLFPASYTAGGGAVALTTSKKGGSCSAEISGTALQSAVSAAGCDQVVRATYLSAGQGLMGTIGVFNLSSAARATKAVKAADASDFVRQLAAKHGKTAKIGQGTGIEEAAAKGHYLILIWAEFTNLRKPKTAGQRTEIENFMTDLLDKTANVSLANRMVSGKP